MNFLKYGFVILVIFAVFSGQAVADRSRNIGRGIANAGRRVGGAYQRVKPYVQQIGRGGYNAGRWAVQGVPVVADVAEIANTADYFVNQYGR